MHLRRFETTITELFLEIFFDCLIFTEKCTADCPQFLEDLQKLGELSKMKIEVMGVRVN